MAINRGNIGMNYYNSGYGAPQMPFAGNRAMMQGHGMSGRQFGAAQSQKGYPMGYQNNFGMQQMQNGRSGLRLPPLINPANQAGALPPGMNMMQGIQNQAGMNMMPGMQNQAGMNMMQGMQSLPQGADGVTFEPYNPSQHQMPQTPMSPTSAPNPIASHAPQSTPSPSSTNDTEQILISFIQGEKNANSFYLNLCDLAQDEHTRSVISLISNNAEKRKQSLGMIHNKMTGNSYSEKDLSIISCDSLSQGIKAAIEIENGSLRELSDLYEKLDNGMHLKSLNSVIQKKISDIISLQQLAMYN